MSLDIPGLTPEMCQARADWLREWGSTPEEERTALDTTHRGYADALFRAALLEQYPARPELRVGDLAKFGSGPPSRVDYIGKRLVVLTDRRGVEWWTASANALTPTGEPAPEGWGQ